METGSVERLNPARASDWDSSVQAHADHSFFHSAAWARVLRGAYGYEPAYFVTPGRAGKRAFLPLFEVDSWLTGRRGVGLPFTDICGPLCGSAEEFRRLFEAALEFGRGRGWKYLECRGGREWFGESAPAAVKFWGHTLDLTRGEAALFETLEGATRRAVRKAGKSGVVVRISRNLDDLREFYRLLCLTRQRHGLPPQSFSFFREIHTQVMEPGQGVVVAASFEGRTIAAAVFFHFGGRVVYKYGASDDRFQHARGANAVMWEAIKWYAGRGAETLHFGRTSVSNEGLRRYKLGWGAAEQNLEYLRYDLRAGCCVAGVDEAEGWYNRVFRRLPVPVLRLVGAALYRHTA